MEITLKQVVAIVESRAVEGLALAKLETKERWNVVKFSKQVQAEYDILDKTRESFAKELGDPSPKGGYQIRPENLPEFNRRMEELLKTTVEVHSIKLPLSKLENVPITALLAFEPWVDETA